MLNEFYSFSERDIAGIDSYKYRALFEGVAASSDEPEVSRAFTILFEDFVPIRIAGRMIYKHLKTVMEKSTEKRLLQEENIIKSTALSAEEIYEGRKAFLAIDPVPPRTLKCPLAECLKEEFGKSIVAGFQEAKWSENIF